MHMYRTAHMGSSGALLTLPEFTCSLFINIPFEFTENSGVTIRDFLLRGARNVPFL
jgi:hypothetical protein